MKKHCGLISFLIIISTTVILCGCMGLHKESNEYQNRDSYSEKVDERLKSIYYDDNTIINNLGGAYYSIYASDRQQNDKIKQKFAGYYGVVNYWTLDAKEDGKITLDYNYKFSNNNGKYKLLLCTPDKKIVKVFENTSGNAIEKSIKVINVPKGINRVVSVGNNAAAQVEILIKTQGDIDIKDVT